MISSRVSSSISVVEGFGLIIVSGLFSKLSMMILKTVSICVQIQKVMSANLSAIFLFLLLHLILPVTEVNWIQQSLSVVRVVVEVVVVTKNCLLSRSLNTVFSHSGATDKTLLR